MKSRTPRPTLGVKVHSPTGFFKVGCALMGVQSISWVLSHGSEQTALGTLGMSRSSVCFRDLEKWEQREKPGRESSFR